MIEEDFTNILKETINRIGYFIECQVIVREIKTIS